jgi:hypothetical protein
MMKKAKTKFERYCDLCKNTKIVDTRKDYHCKICGKKDLCRECRIQLLQNHKEERTTYTYSIIHKGYVCVECYNKVMTK